MYAICYIGPIYNGIQLYITGNTIILAKCNINWIIMFVHQQHNIKAIMIQPLAFTWAGTQVNNFETWKFPCDYIIQHPQHLAAFQLGQFAFDGSTICNVSISRYILHLNNNSTKTYSPSHDWSFNSHSIFSMLEVLYLPAESVIYHPSQGDQMVNHIHSNHPLLNAPINHVIMCPIKEVAPCLPRPLAVITELPNTHSYITIDTRGPVQNTIQRMGTLGPPSPGSKSVSVFIKVQSATGS